MSGDAHEYRVEVAGGLLVVWQRGAPDTLAAVRMFQDELDRVREQTASRRALFDNRETTIPSDDIRHAMLEWVCEPGRFDAVAVVLQSEMLAVRLNMDAIAQRTRMRAFDSVTAAQKWLVDARKP